MVFAPRESAQDIGWGSRQSSSSPKENKSISNKKVSKRKERKQPSSSSSSPQQKQKNDTNSPSSFKQHKKAKGEIGQDMNTTAAVSSCDSVAGGGGGGENDVDLKQQNYYGPAALQSCLSAVSSINGSSALPVPIGNGFTINVISKDDKDNDEDIPMSIVTFEPSSACSQIAIVGRAKICVMNGKVEILGYTLNSNSQKTIIIDSPNWMSSLCISDLNTYEDGKDRPINNDNTTATSTKIKIMSMDRDECSYQLLPMDQVRSPIIIDERWDVAANCILKDLSVDGLCEEEKERNQILVCGAKNVGKSTFVKFLCNRILSNSSFEKVALLDCDVGQPELSPPGLLSLTILTKPLLCPPHVHMVCDNDSDTDSTESYAAVTEHHAAFYYGSTTSKMNPIVYSSAIKELMNDYDILCKNTSENIPLIVNTDGWVKGMGFEILSSNIDIINPGHIVQILGSTKAKFFDLSLHASPTRTIHVAFSQSKSKQEGNNSGSAPISRATSSASVQALNTPEQSSDSKFFDVKDNTPIAASILRNLRLCVYFLGGYSSFIKTGATFQQSGIFDDDCTIALKLANMKPYAVPFDAISCILMDENGNNEVCATQTSEDDDFIYDIFNGSAVGLCHDNEGSDSSLHRCIGLGIIRSIDRARRLYYIITPLPISVLKSQVTTIVRGQSHLPFECIFLGQNSESFPYQSCDGISHRSGEVMKNNISHQQK